ncbi:hypothetical protein GCM10017674_70520 [Streptomyces gardneri]|uniref:Uncharacterized protein n=1 Tax=Streptomyces gardneri TaxID=66892 RepID=A0A4Y3RP05_9ACTN|nr:hypothetical protein SGA01_31850 [Streptomyces gardneri]GHH18486.1 hypothetical protein GCM10017674_70520 [Streptomyces gardneri]
MTRIEVRELQVAGHEVGVEVGVDDADHGEAVRGGVGHVLRDVPARVTYDRQPGLLVADHVRRLGEAVEVVLREEHGNPFVRTRTEHLREYPRGYSRTRP